MTSTNYYEIVVVVSQPSPTLLLEVWFLGKVTERWIDECVGAAGYSADEIGFCSAVARSPGATTSELAELVGLPLTTVASMAGRLERRGTLRSSRHPRDGRARVWELTDAGGAAAAAISVDLLGHYRRLVAGLDLDPEVVRASLNLLERTLRADLGVARRTP